MGHSVSKAAENAVNRSNKKDKAERTTEQIIKDIRNNLAAKLAVTPGDVAVLLAEYDAARDVPQFVPVMTMKHNEDGTTDVTRADGVNYTVPGVESSSLSSSPR